MKKLVFVSFLLAFTVAIIAVPPAKAQEGQADSAYLAQLAAILDGLRAELAALSTQVNSAASVDAASASSPTPTPVPFGPIPNPPSNLQAYPTSVTPPYSAWLQWTDNSSNESGFYVERSSNGYSFARVGTTSQNVYWYSDSIIPAPGTYYYRVRAFSVFGSSTPSNTASVYFAAVPNRPTNLTAQSPGSREVNLFWSDNANNEQGFLVERGPNSTTFPDRFLISTPNTTTFTDRTVTPNTTYWYQVRSYNLAGTSSPSNVVSVIAGGGSASSTPRNLTANLLPVNRVLLSWEEGTFDEQGFVIERGIMGYGGTTLVTTGPNTNGYKFLFYLDAPTASSTSYYYRVGAFNQSQTLYTNYAFVTTQP